MRVGIPTEIKNNEYRVAITPAGVAARALHAARRRAMSGRIRLLLGIVACFIAAIIGSLKFTVAPMA